MAYKLLFFFLQGICDGAAALVMASEEAVNKHGLKPLARIISYGISGVDPSIMGIGPSPAIRIALGRASLSLNDMALVEVWVFHFSRTIVVFERPTFI